MQAEKWATARQKHVAMPSKFLSCPFVLRTVTIVIR